MVKKNGKDIWILVTANSKMYGDIVARTTKLFIAKLKEQNSKKIDLVIIGRQGKNIVDQANLGRTYEYFEIADEKTLVSLKRKSKSKEYRAFIAVFVNNIRLIDTIAL